MQFKMQSFSSFDRSGMEKSWRWFGKKDRITLSMLRQIGVESVVTALHDVKNGEIWTVEAIGSLKDYIGRQGLQWSVVESLPVAEAIKYAGPQRDRLIENYITSLENLGRCGIRTVCYNFMPVIDWVRTDLRHPCPDGGTTLYFDYAKFAYFDIKILGREGAEHDYPPEIVARAEEIAWTMTEQERRSLVDTIIIKTQGFINGNVCEDGEEPVKKFRDLIALYKGCGKEDLRQNLKYFLEAVMPVCEKWDIEMCLHPDDPPMAVLGLPRIVCSEEDIEWLLSAVDNPRSGLAFCAGSLSAGEHNRVEEMARRFASRTHFVHLRSCDILPGGDFIEAPHCAGRVNLVELIRIFSGEGLRRRASGGRAIPMRVDHGRDILGDAEGGYNPGYGFYGRMLAFGQVSGMMAAVEDEMAKKVLIQ